MGLGSAWDWLIICYGLEGSLCHITHHLRDGERCGKVLRGGRNDSGLGGGRRGDHLCCVDQTSLGGDRRNTVILCFVVHVGEDFFLTDKDLCVFCVFLALSYYPRYNIILL